MCDFTMMALAGAAVQGVSALSASRAQAASYNAQAAWAERNAQLARQKAEYDVSRQRDNASRIAGRQRATALASGIDLAGSPMDVMQDTVAESELDVQAIRYGAELQAQSYEMDARMSRMNARRERTGGFFGAISPFLSAGTKIYGQRS